MAKIQREEDELTRQDKHIWRSLRNMGLDEAYVGWKLEDYGLDYNLEWGCHGYFISGVQGSGKSCLAAAMLHDRCRVKHPKTLAVPIEQVQDGAVVRGSIIPDGTNTGKNKYPSIFWKDAKTICDLIRSSWNDKGGELGFIHSMLVNHRIIVIDDLGSEFGTVNQKNVSLPSIRRIIDKCIHNYIDVIVTSNLTLDEIANDDTRMASRLCELEEVSMPERDIRLEKKLSRGRLEVMQNGMKGGKLDERL